MVMVFGEITTSPKVDYENVVRDTCREIGFISDDVGLDADKCKVSHVLYQHSACQLRVPLSIPCASSCVVMRPGWGILRLWLILATCVCSLVDKPMAPAYTG